MKILGVHIGHDSSACLVIDGKIVADVAEERFTRIKHDSGLPIKSIEYCLSHANVSIDELDAVALPGGDSDLINTLFRLDGERSKSFSKKERLLKAYRKGIKKVSEGFPLYVKQFPLSEQTKVINVDHHLAHASSAFYASGIIDDSLIFTIDGVGDGTSVAVWRAGNDGKISSLYKVGHEGSLGWFYGNVTEALGWWHGDGEGKTMGLAPYGDMVPSIKAKLEKYCPIYSQGKLIRPHNYSAPSTWSFSGANHYHFRDAEEISKLLLTHSRENLSATAQAILEEQVKNIVFPWIEKTGIRNICCAGGIFLNVKLNQRILYSGNAREMFVFPNAGDSGLAVGAALHAYNELASTYEPYQLDHLYLGPSWSNEKIEEALRLCNINYVYTENPSKAAAIRLAENKIIGWFQGRMESGPRALGNRSILMSANKPENKDIINARVKFREGFRPFCPSILEEKIDDYLIGGVIAPFMLISFDIIDEKRNRVPAVVHEDGTLRVQTVNRGVNPRYWDLINYFGEITGEYLVLNSSFNIMGEPIVLDPLHAIRCFFGGGMDSLIIGNYIIDK